MKPKKGDTVRVHYTGTLEDGTEFDSSQGREPISFAIGQGDVIPGFDAAVADLEVGGSTTVTIPAADAYGDRHDEALQQVPLEAFDGQLPQAGWVVQMQTPEGQEVRATVAAVANDHIVLDFNHPLAGQDLTFALELVEIVGS